MTRFKFTVCTSLAILVPNLSYPVSLGDRAPKFTLEHLISGEEISLDQFEGKVVYLDFWASWCGPCLKSFPFMNSLHEEYGELGLVVIAVNLDQRPGDAMLFLDEHPASFIVVENQAGDVAEAYDVIAMPSTYIIGRDGLIEEVHHGFNGKAEADLKDTVVDLLSKPTQD